MAMENGRILNRGTSNRLSNSAVKSRLNSSRLEDELQPSDSASNAPSRRTPSISQRPTPSTTRPNDRRTERTTISTKDTIHIRTRNQTTPIRGEDIGNGLASQRSPGRPSHDTKPVTFRSEQKAGAATWKPRASLVEHSTAPLARRVSTPPSSSSVPQSVQAPPLRDLSLEEQEAAILDDLLYSFMGFEGQYIHFVESYRPSEEPDRLAGPGFKIANGLNPSLKDLTMSMLETATHYMAIEAFIDIQSREEFGSVNHALCASMRSILKDYLIMIAQMENQLLTNQTFTLHVLHLHVLPVSNTLLQLYSLTQEILRRNNPLEDDLESDDEDLDPAELEMKYANQKLNSSTSRIQKGGKVLALLTERLSHFSGDPAARKILEGLLKDASKPYMEMLNQWLHRGTIKDPHGEFLIREQKTIDRDRLDEDFTDAYWDKRYTIRHSEVPPQLEGMKDKVLLAGKYLNVVRECGGIDISKEVQEVPQTFDDPRFLTNVSNAYAHANASLLELLLTTHELPARLRSMKHYFFLDRSDFFSAFLFLAGSELRKNAKEVNVGKLQSLLDLVLRQPGSVASEDPYKEDIKVHMNDQNLTRFLMSVVYIQGMEEGEELLPKRSVKTDAEDAKNLTGFTALEFKYAVPFPLSLVISSKTVVRYQILFRYLLSLRHLENLLVTSWEDHNKAVSWTHKSRDPRIEAWKRRAWTLRARMLNFVQSFMYYCTSEVIEPNWQSLMEKVNGKDKSGKATTRTVDELMEDHVDFLDTCLKECMLMNPKLLKVREKLVTCCYLFAIYTPLLSRLLCSVDRDFAGSKEAMEYLQTLYPSARHPVPENHKAYDPKVFVKINEDLTKYEDNFNRHIKILLAALDYYAATETVALSRLCAQLSMASEKGGEGRIA